MRRGRIKVHRQLISDYQAFTEGFVNAREGRVAEVIEALSADGVQWPDPWLSLNPSFASGGTIDELVVQGRSARRRECFAGTFRESRRYGAAATPAGLAALGGGSLAEGGFGMAGGTAIISTEGELGGLRIGTGAAHKVDSLRQSRIRVLGRVVSDVVKLHVLCKLVLIDELHDVAALDAVMSDCASDWGAPGVSEFRRLDCTC